MMHIPQLPGYHPSEAETEEERKRLSRPLGVSYLVAWIILIVLAVVGVWLLIVFHG